MEIEIGSYFVNIAVPEYPFFSDELCQYDLYFSLNSVSYLFAFIELISIFVSLKHIISGSSFCINLSNSSLLINALSPFIFQLIILIFSLFFGNSGYMLVF